MHQGSLEVWLKLTPMLTWLAFLVVINILIKKLCEQCACNKTKCGSSFQFLTLSIFLIVLFKHANRSTRMIFTDRMHDFQCMRNGMMNWTIYWQQNESIQWISQYNKQNKQTKNGRIIEWKTRRFVWSLCTANVFWECGGWMF